MDILIVILISVFAAIMQAAVGFGFAVVFTPLLSLFIGARDAIALSLILSMTISLALYLSDRPRASLRSVLPMFMAATLVTPLGVYILAVADERLLRAGIGIAVLSSVVGTLRTPHRTAERPERLSLTLVVGMISGLLRGATGMGGPPVVVYEHWRGAPMLLLRRRLLAYFALTGVAGTSLAAMSGIFTRDIVIMAAAGMPAILVALFGGRYIRPRISDAWFRRLSMILLVFMGCISLFAALR